MGVVEHSVCIAGTRNEEPGVGRQGYVGVGRRTEWKGNGVVDL